MILQAQEYEASQGKVLDGFFEAAGNTLRFHARPCFLQLILKDVDFKAGGSCRLVKSTEETDGWLDVEQG